MEEAISCDGILSSTGPVFQGNLREIDIDTAPIAPVFSRICNNLGFGCISGCCKKK